MRSGRYVQQIEGYSAFIPAPLPPEPPIKMDAELHRLLSNADRALGRLDGATSILPNPDLFVAMYVRQEAVLSSQIEGTQSTLEDVLQYEIDVKGQERFKDVQEVVNYVNAMNYGLKRLQEFPLCLRLLREIHAELLKDVRGSDRTPGEFRKSQNWIGPQGCNLGTAAYVPPTVAEMHQSLDNLERFLHDTNSLPVLIHCGLAHAQFETIHPFLDGIGQKISSSSYGLRLLDLLFHQPIVNIRLVQNELQCTYATASKIVDKFVEVTLLQEVTGWQRNRLYRYEPYLDLFESSYTLINPEKSDSIASTQSE